MQAPVTSVRLGMTIAATLLLALQLPSTEPVHGQDTVARYLPAESAVSPAGVLGPWVLNEELSEDPVLEAGQAAREGRWISSILQEEAGSFADRRQAILIRIEDGSVLVLDGRGETRAFPLGAAWRSLDSGVRVRALSSDDTLSIETIANEWLGVDTFVREQDQLVRTTDLRSHRLDNVGLRFRSVYERPAPGSRFDHPASDHPFVDTVGGFARPATILIVPPERGYRQPLSGRVGFQTLVIDPSVTAVDYRLDGRPPKRIRQPRYRTHIELDDPPREQTLEVLAYGEDGELLGTDKLVLNRVAGPAAIHIASIRGEPEGSAPAVLVDATVSPPWSAQLERVEFYRSESLVTTVDDFGEATKTRPPQAIHVEALIESPQPNDFVRVRAKFTDGRDVEDAKLLQEGDYRAEIDVRLVQIQVLVTDREGNPVSRLTAEDFEIREGSSRIKPEQLHTANDIRLLLGLAIDSSESMRPAWSHLRHVVRSFLGTSLSPADSAFLVDFDDTVRLLQPPTADQHQLRRHLRQLVPGGGTALHDGLLFSLLQFRRESGRRALVVVTDGVDVDSRSRWQQAPDYAERLGIPIYFIELDRSAKPVIGTGSLAGRTSSAALLREQARRRLRRISRHTGGRHFHVDLVANDIHWTHRVEGAFGQIEEDLRHHHVLTYYTEQPPDAPAEPEILLTRQGLKLRSAVPLWTTE
ncbi:MAG: VWA domain-containing protein [Acidobacteriota bacterium]|nr:VWA domain-containing protein [Acidobacteriota bacterium]